jgi:uncharacterized membrane protein
VVGVITALATAASGLSAGLYYAYSCSVMPGLRAAAARAPEASEVSMRAINVAIENPAFFATFVGAPALTAAALATDAPRGWIVASLALHAVTIGVTVAVSIPLNDALADGGAWAAFADPWTGWNHVRTASSIGAFVCLLAALRG